MMVEISILIPQRDAGAALSELTASLDATLRGSGQSYEILIVDDASQAETTRQIEQLCHRHAAVRWLRLDRRSGLSSALTAGMAAAQGDVVVAIEASRQYLPQQFRTLTDRLARADFVCGRRQRSRLMKCLLALAQAPRRLLLGLEVRDPDCLFWAARREALVGLELSAGMHRFLGSLVTTRGFRVSEIHVDHQPTAGNRSFSQAWPSLGNLLSAWWHRQSFRPCAVVELGADGTGADFAAQPLQGQAGVRRAA